VDAGVIKDGKATDSETCQLMNKRRALRHRIDNWRDIQDTYMPAVTKYRAQSPSSDDSFEHPEAIPLLLPSALPVDILSTIPSNFVKIETRLRISEADDSLHDLKRFLRTTTSLWDFKCTNVGPSQRSKLRVYSAVKTYREKVNRCANRYRAAYQALSVLDPGGTWVTRLQELKSTDVRPPIRDMDKVPKQQGSRKSSAKIRTNRKDPEVSEGRRMLSWIWLVGQPQGNESEGGENTEVTQDKFDESKS